MIHIRLDDLTDPTVIRLLENHYQDMFNHSPPESVHALDLASLRAPDIRFFSAWIDGKVAGCGALRELSEHHAEIKSMRTDPAFLRKGVAAAVLQRLLDEAKKSGYLHISLETGTTAAFKPAQRLYERFGFSECGPFDKYQLDPYSLFMTKGL